MPGVRGGMIQIPRTLQRLGEPHGMRVQLEYTQIHRFGPIQILNSPPAVVV
jgi:hypothetical protein